MRVVNYNGKYLVSIGRLLYYGKVAYAREVLAGVATDLSDTIPPELVRNLLSTTNRNGVEFLFHQSSYVRMLAVKAISMDPKPYALSVIYTSKDPSIMAARDMYLSKMDEKHLTEMRRLYPKTRSLIPKT